MFLMFLILTRKHKLFSEIICQFGNVLVNRPETLLDSEFTRIEHLFYAADAVSIVFKLDLSTGKNRLDVLGQILAQCAGMLNFLSPLSQLQILTVMRVVACDYSNMKAEHWVPILGILCDGKTFQFIVYDSGSKSVHSSRVVTGLIDMKNNPRLYLLSMKACK